MHTNANETLPTLRHTNRARNIKNNLKMNFDQLVMEVERLENLVNGLQEKLGEKEAQLQKLNIEKEDEIAKLKELRVEKENTSLELGNLDSLKIVELKRLLKQYGKPVSGKKHALVARLRNMKLEEERVRIMKDLHVNKLLKL